MVKTCRKPSQPRRPFYDEEGYVRRNPYLLRVLDEYPERLIPPSEAIGRRGRWKEWAEGRPLHVEIGPGKGKFITAYSLAHPDVRVLGIELKFRRLFKTAKRLTEAAAFNCRLIRFDANFLSHLFAPNEVERIFVFFPDPWWKKERQRFRSLITASYLAQVFDILTPGGALEIKTDHPERYEEYCRAVAESAFSLSRSTPDLARSEWATDNIETIFEEKFHQRGITTGYIRAVKPKFGSWVHKLMKT